MISAAEVRGSSADPGAGRVPTASALVRGRLLGPYPRLEERGAEMVRDAVDQVFQLREERQVSRGRARDRGRDRGTGLERRGGPLRIAEIAIPGRRRPEPCRKRNGIGMDREREIS